MRILVAALFVTTVAASAAGADESATGVAPAGSGSAVAPPAATNAPVGSLAATASREVGQVVSVVQVTDPRDQAAEDRANAANAERCRPASERDGSLIPLAP